MEKGYGTEVCNGLINYGFDQLKLQKVKARMYAANIGSKRLSEKCGMTLVNSGTEKGIEYLEFELRNIKIKPSRSFLTTKALGRTT